MSQPENIRIASLGEAVGTTPALLGYVPSAGDVTVLASSAGKVGLTANVRAESWDDLAEDSAGLGTHLDSIVTKADADALLVMGHGFQGEQRALALTDAMAKASSLHTVICGVHGERFREISHDLEGDWADQMAPNPALAVEGGVAEPAANRDAAFARYSIIEADVPEDDFIQEAREYAKTLPNNAQSQATAAMKMLRAVDTSEDCRWTVAVVGELVSQSKNVRDACLVEMLGDNPPDLEQLTYVARASHEQHRAEVSALTTICHYFDGKQAAVSTFGERAQDTTLGKLALEAYNAGMPPTPEFKKTLHAAAQDAQSLPARPEQSAPQTSKPNRSQRPSTSVQGVDPLSGPSSSPGLDGPGMA